VTGVAQLPRDVHAPARARALVERLAPDVDGDVLADAKLLVSELITNGVKHGAGGPVTLELRVDGPRHVRVEVVDQGTGFEPVARERDRTDPGGWGLELVRELADRWGAYPGSTHVWFEIDRD
jgi:anti-sigma regulatory factor (Ser/Thr protein kinase)